VCHGDTATHAGYRLNDSTSVLVADTEAPQVPVWDRGMMSEDVREVKFAPRLSLPVPPPLPQLLTLACASSQAQHHGMRMNAPHANECLSSSPTPLPTLPTLSIFYSFPPR
jgi:hypothetical protein